MKKYLILAAAAALTLASCAKVETFTKTEMDEDIPIGFNNYTPRSMSKADGTLVNTGALPSGSQIGVYGYSTATANLASNFTTKPTFLTNALVNYASTTSATATASNPVRYWPKTVDNLLSFFAYYPKNPNNKTSLTGIPNADTEGMGSFTFTQAGTVADMVDFMISDVANDQYFFRNGQTPADPENASGVKAFDGTVPLKFNHMLTKVNFKFKAAADYGDAVEIKVTSAKITEDVLSKVVLTPVYTAPSSVGSLGSTDFSYTSDTPYKNEGTTGSDDIIIPINSNVNNTDKSYIILSTSAAFNSEKTDNSITEQNFLFVPQVLGNNVKVIIEYSITQNGNKTDNVAEVQLNKVMNNADPAAAITEWHINDFVTYTFAIGLREIRFTGNVDTGWAAINSADFLIQ